MAIKNIENVTIVGRVKWAIVQKPRVDKFNTGAGPMYTVSLEMDKDKFEKLKAKGLHPATKLHLDKEDGRGYIKLKAKGSNANGEPVKFTVVDKEKNDFTGLIGNGSTCKVACSLITTDAGLTILRMKGLQVVELVEFVPDETKTNVSMFDDDEDVI